MLMQCGHDSKWLAYRNPADVTTGVYCVFCELERLQRELNRANRIAGKADRMFDAIRELQQPGIRDVPARLRSVIKSADAYDLALSDPAAEATDVPVLCRRCEREINEGHDRG